jgi:hypothetical protein
MAASAKAAIKRERCIVDLRVSGRMIVLTPDFDRKVWPAVAGMLAEATAAADDRRA